MVLRAPCTRAFVVLRAPCIVVPAVLLSLQPHRWDAGAMAPKKKVITQNPDWHDDDIFKIESSQLVFYKRYVSQCLNLPYSSFSEAIDPSREFAMTVAGIPPFSQQSAKVVADKLISHEDSWRPDFDDAQREQWKELSTSLASNEMVINGLQASWGSP